MKVKPLVTTLVAAVAASAGIVSAQPGASADVTTTAYAPTAPMTFVTANIGRNYSDNSIVSNAMKRIRHNAWDVSNGRPRYIGWQEIDGNDPAPEMRILKRVYPASGGWERKLYRQRSDGTWVKLYVPNVAHDAQRSHARVAFGSAGLRRASVTRYITIVRYRNQKISHLNTHFIAGAFRNCSDRCDQRRERWWKHWRNLKEQVAKERNAGFNVVVTGDFNRKRVSGGWSPANLHWNARHVKNGGVDHIVAVSRAGWKVTKLRRPNGSFKQGAWWIGIDGHKAHWVKLRFLRK